MQNLAEALDQVFLGHGQVLQAVNEALGQAPVTQPDGTLVVPVPPPAPPRKAQELANQRQARRLALPQPIWAYHRHGWPGWAIAQPLGVGTNTVVRDLRTETLPVRKRRTDRGRRRLTPYTAYLRARWNAGCRDALRLWRERQPRGYPGSYATVARYAQRLRHAHGGTSRQRRPRHPLPVVAAPSPRALTPRRATWLVLRRPETQDEHDTAQIAQLKAQPPEVAAAMVFAQDFARLVRERQADQLDSWLARAADSPCVPLQRFAKGRRDDDPVKAGLPWRWSNGPVEGHLNRLTMLQRQMCGRASLELLQRRLLLAA